MRVIYLLLLTLFAGLAQAQVYIFGDSLSDTGNLASIQGNFPNPPFYNNRVSNGPVAVETLAQLLGGSANASLYLTGPEQGTNYSVAGATAGGERPIDLLTQVGAFLQNHAGAAPADNVYVIFIGGNDVRGARDNADYFAGRKSLTAAVSKVNTAAHMLLAAGAKKLMFVNVPDIGSIPETKLLAAAKQDWLLTYKASDLTRNYNRKLREIVENLEKEQNADYVYFDLFSEFNHLLSDASALGYTVTDSACFSSQTFQFNASCQYGQAFDQHVFFDEIHPSAITHKRAGWAMAAQAPK
ncbi:MAG: SGNH/GDSL hydrolase family protein [Oceanospirillaceae bacterium]|nr:SGNH/GDSL hydrolase family protein [Oceanospirillaceae bacterium]MCP5336051.1 SGNH/GDSL hydrolase family protein [Oceanospirillaceae bacterium]MCP5350289.1 SGNH/GDSL hydrolase family protein [Oceanospirillaceae bacterium]